MYKIVLDTNVLINGVQDENSYTYKIIAACISGDLTAYLSKKTKREHERLAKRLINDEEYLNILDDFYEATKMVSPDNYNDLIADDPEDNKFLDVAEAGEANYIISSDHHLLDLQKFEKAEIVEPADFWHHYQAEIGEDNEGANEWNSWASSIGIE